MDAGGRRAQLATRWSHPVTSVSVEETVGMSHTARRFTMGPANRGQTCHTWGTDILANHRPAGEVGHATCAPTTQSKAC